MFQRIFPWGGDTTDARTRLKVQKTAKSPLGHCPPHSHRSSVVPGGCTRNLQEAGREHSKATHNQPQPDAMHAAGHAAEAHGLGAHGPGCDLATGQPHRCALYVVLVVEVGEVRLSHCATAVHRVLLGDALAGALRLWVAAGGRWLPLPRHR